MNEKITEEEQYIIEYFEKEYKEYPKLQDIKLKMINLYLNEYRHLKKFQEALGYKELSNKELLEKTFEIVNKSWGKILKKFPF